MKTILAGEQLLCDTCGGHVATAKKDVVLGKTTMPESTSFAIHRPSECTGEDRCPSEHAGRAVAKAGGYGTGIPSITIKQYGETLSFGTEAELLNRITGRHD